MRQTCFNPSLSPAQAVNKSNSSSMSLFGAPTGIGGGTPVSTAPTLPLPTSTASVHSFASPQVALMVGPDRIRMTAHKSTLCQWSYFRVALLGDFKEAESQCIELPEDYPEIVQAFLEFIYSGNYVFQPSKAQKCKVRNHNMFLAGSVCPCEKFVVCGTPAMKSGKPNFDLCLVCEHSIYNHCADASLGNPPTPVTTVEQDLERIEFHARVYFLADKFGISKLQTLALDRIYAWNETPYDEKKINELKVANLIYLNTSPGDKLLRRVALERTVDLLLTTNSVTPSPVQAKEDFAKPAPPPQAIQPTAAFGQSPWIGRGCRNPPPLSSTAPPPPNPNSPPSAAFPPPNPSSHPSSSTAPPLPGPGVLFHPPRDTAIGGGFSFAVPAPRGTTGGPSGNVNSRDGAPVIRDSEANAFLEELATQNPSLVADIIKCMARNGVPLSKYY